MTANVKSRLLLSVKSHQRVYGLLLCLLIASIIGWNWYVDGSNGLNSIQLSLQTHLTTKSLAQYSGSIILFRILDLFLYVHNPSKYSTPSFFLEAPNVLVNESDYDVSCVNGTLIAFTGRSDTPYISECDTLNPITIGPNQTILLAMRVILPGGYTSNQDPRLYGSLAVSLRAFMNVREPFFDPQKTPPPFRDRSGDCSCLDITAWITREFHVSAIASE